MTDREVVANYRWNVLSMNCLIHSIDWNQRHGLPVLDMPDQVQELKKYILRFEDILAEMPSKKSRIIMRCRFALGWSVPDTAIFMDMSCGAVSTLTKFALRQLE